VETLLPATQKTGTKPSAGYVRKLMSHAVSMEIVPFKSNNEVGVDDALETCWNNFTRHIIERASASIFVLVGE
jgi:hypothetical protein